MEKRSKGIIILVTITILFGVYAMHSSFQQLRYKPNYEKDFAELKKRITQEITEEEFNKLDRRRFDAAVKIKYEFMENKIVKRALIFKFFDGTILIILGISLFSLKGWSRKFAIVYSILKIPILILSSFILYQEMSTIIANSNPEFALPLPPPLTTQLTAVLSILLYLIVIYYLTRPKVKEQFK